MAEIIIRKARREDCKAIRALIQELADYEKMSDGPQIDYKSLERDGFDEQLFSCNVATSNEKVIGYAIFYHTYSTWTGKVMYLEDLYVTQEFRGKQVGSKLLKSVAKEAVKTNCVKMNFVVLNWNQAQEFYKLHGANDLTSLEKWHYYHIPSTEVIKLASECE